jgi:hypothetical protein
MTPSLRTAALGLTALALLLPGCAGKPKPIKVTGTLTKAGKPISAPPETYMTLSFRPAAADGVLSNATLNRESGTFEVEVLPGTYHLTFLMAGPRDPNGKPTSLYRFESNDPKYTYEFTKQQEGLAIDLPAK